MIDSPMSKLVSVVIVVAVLFLFPIIWAAQKGDYLSQKKAEKVVYDFVTNVCDRGYIDDTLYEAFMANLSSTGNTYKIEMMHRQNIYEPEYSGATFTGNVMEYVSEAYTAQILGAVYDGNGAYLMNKGDTFEVSIILATEGLAQSLTNNTVGVGTTGYYKASMAVTGISHQIREKYIDNK